jgi:serine/threonine-protein kinase RsbW/stage II sporulation protein AB (anti-sigma F factor)
MARRFAASYEATPRTVGVVRDEIAALARTCGLDEVDVGDVRLAVSEAATNALIHGCRDERGSCQIHVEAELIGDELQVDIIDDGIGMRPRTDSPGLGLGLSVMAMVSQRLEFREVRRGTRVRMAFPCPRTH